MTNIDTSLWERSSLDNWESPTPNSLKMKVNLNHDYIVSDVSYVNYTLSSNVSVLANDDDGIGVVFDFIDADNYKFIMYQGGGLNAISSRYENSPVTLIEVKNGLFNTLLKSTVIPYWNKDSTFSIKLENLFSDINFYVNDVLALRYRKEDTSTGKIGFVAHSQIADFNDIVMEQSLTNRVVAKYKLYAVGDSDVPVEIEVKQYGDSDTETEITPRAYRESIQDTYLNVMYRGNSDVAIEIQPYGFHQWETEIEVPPHNRMWAVYEVQQPPVVNDINNPIMDAFTRSEGVYATVNNGSGTSMVVGKQNGHIWDSYIKFDVSHLQDSLFFLGAKLRLYYTGTFPALDIEVHEISGTWEEYAITYLNTPTTFRLINDKYTINPLQRYIEFDVFDIVLEWITNPTMNLGFYLKVSDSSPDGQMIFRTRESVQPPELIVDHYSTAVFSMGRSDVVTEINAMRANLSEHNAEITVDSTFNFSIFDTEIYCHRVEVPLDSDIELEITVTKPYEDVILIVSPIKEDDAETEISVYSSIQVSEHDTEIVATKPLTYVEIYSANLCDYETEISVTHKTRHAEITVSNIKTLAEVYVKHVNDVEVEIEINKLIVPIEITAMKFSDIEAEIEINADRRNDVLTEINISHESRHTEITPRITGESRIYTEIVITKPYIFVEIRTPEQSNMETEIDVRPQSSVHAEITANGIKVYAEVNVVAYGESNIDAEIYVKWVNFLPIEITSRSVSQLDVEIDVRNTSNVDAMITVSNDRMYVEISPRLEGEHDVFTVLEPRINMVDNIDTIIVVGSRKGAYGFVM